MYIYIHRVYIYVCVCQCVCMYIYIYLHTEFRMKNGMRITKYRFAMDLNGQCCKQDKN